MPGEAYFDIVRKDRTVKQRWVAKCGWGCAGGENKKTSLNLSTFPRKQPKNEEDLIQKVKTTSRMKITLTLCKK